MAVGIPIVVAYPVVFVGVGIVVWLLFSLIWFIGGRIGRVTGAGARLDQFLDTGGTQLPDEVRIMDDGGFRGGIGGL